MCQYSVFRLSCQTSVPDLSCCSGWMTNANSHIPITSERSSQKSGCCSCTVKGDQPNINAHSFGMECAILRCLDMFGYIVHSLMFHLISFMFHLIHRCLYHKTAKMLLYMCVCVCGWRCKLVDVCDCSTILILKTARVTIALIK